MRHTIIILLLSAATTAWSQVPDTVYTVYGSVQAKRVRVTKVQEFGTKKIEETNVLDSLGVASQIAAAEQDSVQIVQYLDMLNRQQQQINDERIRMQKLYREALRYRNRLRQLLASLQ